MHNKFTSEIQELQHIKYEMTASNLVKKAVQSTLNNQKAEKEADSIAASSSSSGAQEASENETTETKEGLVGGAGAIGGKAKTGDSENIYVKPSEESLLDAQKILELEFAEQRERKSLGGSG